MERTLSISILFEKYQLQASSNARSNCNAHYFAEQITGNKLKCVCDNECRKGAFDKNRVHAEDLQNSGE